MNQQTTQQDYAERKAPQRIPWELMTRRQRKNRRRINRIAEYWPELFNSDPVKPVKLGLIHDMLHDAKARELPIGCGVLRGALTSYIHTTRYLKAIAAGGKRYDLKGRHCGEVTEEEKSLAGELLILREAQIKQQNSQQNTTGDDGDDS